MRKRRKKNQMTGRAVLAGLVWMTFAFPIRAMDGPVPVKIICREDGMKIRWEKVDGAEEYAVYRDDEEPRYVKRNFYKDTLATAGECHTYRIAARIGGEMKDISETVTGCFLEQPGMERICGTQEEVSLSWKSIPEADGYLVETARSADFQESLKIRTRENLFTLQTEGTEPLYVRVRGFIGNREEKTFSPWSTECAVIPYDLSHEFASCSEIHEGIAALYRSGAAERKEKTVCVNAGHGTVDGSSYSTLSHPDGSPKVTGGTNQEGAVYSMAISSGTDMLDGTPEARVTLSEAEILKETLLKEGFDVLMVRENENARLDNVARTVMANQHADCHIAIHYDSTDYDKGAFAIVPVNLEVYTSMYPVSEYGQAHVYLGQCLTEGIRNAGGKIFGEGLMEMDLTQISYSTVPSVDIEIGDRASAYDADTQQLIAAGITAGIKAYFGF